MIRGEVWLAALDPVRGSEQAGTRPVLILQADPLNSFLRTVVIVPLTTNLQWARLPFCVPVNAGDGGLATIRRSYATRSVWLTSPVCSADWGGCRMPQWCWWSRGCE